jgi:lipocalin
MLKMNRFYVWVLSLAGLLTGTTCRGDNAEKINTSTVKQFDVERFMGRWYETARYEHRFERGMTHVTAEYTLQPDGKIRVVNRGLKDGKPKDIVGKARQPDPVKYPGRLEVSFFLWFYSDYYVLELGEEYQYAVIGSSTDKYLWILSRNPDMPQWQLKQILGSLRRRGYDLSRLVYVEQ